MQDVRLPAHISNPYRNIIRFYRLITAKQGYLQQILPFRPISLKMQDMEKAEIKAIGDFLSDVYEGICEQDSPDTHRLQQFSKNG